MGNANVSAPFGLRILENQDFMLQKWPVVVGNSTAIFKGDPVGLGTDGNITPLGASGVSYIGVAQGLYNSKGVELSYLPATTAGFVTVATNPFLRLLIQGDSTTLTQAAIGDSADFTATAGNTSTGQSKYSLATASLAGSAASKMMKILNILPTPDNDMGTYPLLEVVAGVHYLVSTPNSI